MIDLFEERIEVCLIIQENCLFAPFGSKFRSSSIVYNSIKGSFTKVACVKIGSEESRSRAEGILVAFQARERAKDP